MKRWLKITTTKFNSKTPTIRTTRLNRTPAWVIFLSHLKITTKRNKGKFWSNSKATSPTGSPRPRRSCPCPLNWSTIRAYRCNNWVFLRAGSSYRAKCKEWDLNGAPQTSSINFYSKINFKSTDLALAWETCQTTSTPPSQCLCLSPRWLHPRRPSWRLSLWWKLWTSCRKTNIKAWCQITIAPWICLRSNPLFPWTLFWSIKATPLIQSTICWCSISSTKSS